jgi:hypothetical protein
LARAGVREIAGIGQRARMLNSMRASVYVEQLALHPLRLHMLHACLGNRGL